MPFDEGHVFFFLWIFRIEDDGHWAIIDEFNCHICSEDPSFDRDFRFQQIIKIIIELAGHLWIGCPNKGWTIAFFCLGKEGKLRNREEYP